MMDERTRRALPIRPRIVAAVFLVLVALLVYAYVAARIQFGNRYANPVTLITELLEPLREQRSPDALLMFYGRLFLHSLPLVGGVVLGYIVARTLVQQLYGVSAGRADAYLPPSSIGKPSPIIKLDRTQWADQVLNNALLRVGGPGAIEIEKPDVVITERDGRYSRFLVPSEQRQRLKQFEYVSALIEIRKYEANERDFKLISREGFNWYANVDVKFEVAGCSITEDEDTGKTIIKMSEPDLRRVAYAELHHEKGVYRWDDLPLQIVLEQLTAAAAKRKLSDAVDHYDGRQIVMNTEIQREVEDKTREIVAQYGIALDSVRINDMRLDETFHQVYVEQWEQVSRERAFLHVEQSEAEKAEAKRNEIRQSMMMNLARGLSQVQERAAYNNVFAASRLEVMELLKAYQRGGGTLAPEPEPQPNPIDDAPIFTDVSDSPEPEYVTVERERLNKLYNALRREFPDETW